MQLMSTALERVRLPPIPPAPRQDELDLASHGESASRKHPVLPSAIGYCRSITPACSVGVSTSDAFSQESLHLLLRQVNATFLLQATKTRITSVEIATIRTTGMPIPHGGIALIK